MINMILICSACRVQSASGPWCFGPNAHIEIPDGWVYLDITGTDKIPESGSGVLVSNPVDYARIEGLPSGIMESISAAASMFNAQQAPPFNRDGLICPKCQRGPVFGWFQQELDAAMQAATGLKPLKLTGKQPGTGEYDHE